MFTIPAFQLGKYLISPLSRPAADGRYASAVSIKSGHGQATHDRVLRFVPTFDTAQQALRFAAVQGEMQAQRWLSGRMH